MREITKYHDTSKTVKERAKNKLFGAVYSHTAIILLLILLQIGIMVLTFTYLGNYSTYMNGVISLLSFITAIYIFNEKGNPAFKMTWILFVFLVPVVGVGFYLFTKAGIGTKYLGARLEKFNLESLAGITQTDEMELWSVGEKKTAVFAVIPDNDSSFNFLVGMLYTQLFQQLYYQADIVHGGRLPVHVHFVMDEFANVALPDEFDKLLATMRSREISVSIIIQNLAQLKALFEKQWESIVGNCDEFLYLGGNEQSTHEYVSKLLGKETIDTNTYGQSKGRNGSYSVNWQITGRELMTPDEVRMLDNRCALLFIRGERPVKDFKYDVLKHPNVKLTTDGGMEPYQHGQDTRSIASVVLDAELAKKAEKLTVSSQHDFVLLTEEELEEHFKKMEEKQHEKQK